MRRNMAPGLSALKRVDWPGWIALAWVCWWGWAYCLMVVDARWTKLLAWLRSLITGY